MNEPHRRKRYVDAVRTLLREWDPIGVADVAPQGEYDMYAGALADMVMRGSSREQLVQYLLTLQTENMALNGDRPRAERVARRLLELRRESDGRP